MINKDPLSSVYASKSIVDAAYRSLDILPKMDAIKDVLRSYEHAKPMNIINSALKAINYLPSSERINSIRQQLDSALKITDSLAHSHSTAHLLRARL